VIRVIIRRAYRTKTYLIHCNPPIPVVKQRQWSWGSRRVYDVGY